MYRPYIIIGMNSIGRKLIYIFGILTVFTSRILYFFLGRWEFSDNCGYFAGAVIQTGGKEPEYSSGLSCIYTETLSDVFLFLGNRIEAAGLCNLVFQAVWLALISAGIGMFAGRIAGIVAGGMLTLSPQVAETMFQIQPSNYYMLHFSVVLVILGSFFRRMMKAGWHMNISDNLYLLFAGIYLGIVCIWNSIGLFLFLPLAYMLLKDFKETQRKVQAKALGAGLAAICVLAGIVLGGLAAWINEMETAGDIAAGPFRHFTFFYKDFQDMGRDIGTDLLLWLLGSIGAGWICQIAAVHMQNRRNRQLLRGEEENMWKEPGKKQKKQNSPAPHGQPDREEKTDNYIITEDGRKIKLLDNPLPVPKRHVPKAMRFDIEDVSGDLEELKEELGAEFKENFAQDDDFDFKICDDDDFDI